ncbi:MAG: copper amine oxidase N-terminal domain-containing protein [Desulforudis sp.]|nr:MAG: copper amine oxidase N-terminal domain-containing protein [Desulforudis sp.]
MRKTIIIVMALLLMMVLAVPAWASYNYNVSVYVKDGLVAFPDQKPFVDTKANRTYVPLRFVSESLGAEVDWDGAKQTAIVKKDGKVITMKIGSNKPTVDGKTKTLDAPALLLNGRTMVPLRFVSEALGTKVDWVPPGSVYIDSTVPDTPPSPPTPPPTGDTKVINGYTVPIKTDIEVRVPAPSTGAEFGISVKVYKPLEPQYADLRVILGSKFDSATVDEVVNYVKQKTDAYDNLPDKRISANGRTIEIGSNAGNSYIDILIRCST